MKPRTFQLKEILPNPFRDFEQNPLSEQSVENLIESVQATQFWENLEVRINESGKPELVYGHHTLAALRRIYPGTKEFDWRVVSLTDGGMIQKMARENLTQRGPSVGELFEAIKAAVVTHGEGKILPIEMPIARDTRTEYIRYAPSFTQNQPAPPDGARPYTVQSLANFLGLVKPNARQEPKDSFVAAFGALELISEGYLTDARIKGLEVRKLGEVVAAVKKQRDAAIKEAKRLAEEAEARRQDAIRKAAELKKQQEEAEARRKAAEEAERLAAIKRAEEKAKRDAEEKIRREAEEKRKKVEAEQRAAAEAKRKEEEERQRKIREQQRAEAEHQRVEAEKVRQAALAKAKKEEDERKAAQMKKDAEAAAARAEAEAKRKEEAARQAEIAAKKRAEEEKERQAREKKKREEDEARREAQRKAQKEEAERKEAERAAEAKRKVEEAKKAAEEAARKKQAEIAAAEAEARRKDAEAKKEAAEAKRVVAATASRLAEDAKTMNRDDIRSHGQRVAEDEASKVGRKAAPRVSESATVDYTSEVKRFLDDMKQAKANPSAARLPKGVPEKVVRLAKEMVDFSYREFAKKKHPDQGGSHEEMQLLNATVSWLRNIIEEKKQ